MLFNNFKDPTLVMWSEVNAFVKLLEKNQESAQNGLRWKQDQGDQLDSWNPDERKVRVQHGIRADRQTDGNRQSEFRRNDFFAESTSGGDSGLGSRRLVGLETLERVAESQPRIRAQLQDG